MSDTNSKPTLLKKIVFSLIILISVSFIFVFSVAGYFAYKKLTLSYDYCKSFGEIHAELGWTLQKNIDSCLSLSNKVTGEVFFDTTIYTDENGFRAEKSVLSKDSKVLAIGDSWTFGYGVNGNETYPYYLSKMIDEPVANSGIPAYGSGSNYLYAKSNIEKIRPKTVIYLTLGMMPRSICYKPWDAYTNNVGDIKNYPNQQIIKQLLPCYLIDPIEFKAKLISPLPDVIEKSVENHVYPGGSLTAGYDSFWSYVFFTKPKLVMQNIKERLGYTKHKEYTNLEHYILKKYELNSLLDLAEKYDFELILVDPNNIYYQQILNGEINNIEYLTYISELDWQEYILNKTEGMIASDIIVPMDGHFGKGVNKLIANLIYQKAFVEKSQ